MSEAEFRWQIGWYRIEDAANTVNISTLSDSTGTVYQTLSQLSDLSNSNLALTLAQQLVDNSLTSNSEVVDNISKTLNSSSNLDALYRSLIADNVGLVPGDTGLVAESDILLRSIATIAFSGSEVDTSIRAAERDALIALLGTEDGPDEDVRSIREAFASRLDEKVALDRKILLRY